jgi:hypothetical protein
VLDPDHTQLLTAIVDQLRLEGAPQGMWLIEIAQARQALQNADGLLRRMSEAIIAGASPPD